MSSDERDMRFRLLGEDYTFTVGEKVYIEVDKNSSTGVWEGEVTWSGDGTSDSGYRRVRAKITDPKVKGYDHGTFFDTEPHANYSVFPLNTFTYRLFSRLERLETELATAKRNASIREDAYMRALVGLSAGQAEAKAKEAYERGLREARVEAEKKA